MTCMGVFALGQFHRASGSIFTPILMERYALPAATIAGLVSAMFFASIAAQIPFGAALDRFGTRRVLSLCILGVALGAAGFAGVASFEGALVARIVIGVGLASMGAATHVIVARNFPASDFGYVSGLVVTLGGVGGMMGTYPLAFALENAPWPLVFGGVAALTAIFALVVFRTISDEGGAPKQAEGEKGGYLSLVRSAEFRKILTLAFMTFAPITAITGLWGGPYFQTILGLSPERAGLALFVLFGATIASAYLAGLLDRRARRRHRVILIGAGASAASLFTLASLEQPSPWLAFALLLAMISCQQFYILLGAHMRRTTPDHLLARASSLFSFVAVAAIPLTQIGFGAVLDFAEAAGLSAEARYRAAFACLGGVILLTALVYMTAKEADGVTGD